jgi:hypothetical protein
MKKIEKGKNLQFRRWHTCYYYKKSIFFSKFCQFKFHKIDDFRTISAPKPVIFGIKKLPKLSSFQPYQKNPLLTIAFSPKLMKNLKKWFFDMKITMNTMKKDEKKNA